ncbi:hypothetical protein EVAR_92954_1 [Eumeta japonica]|uniref:Uncharacterized protein n=1 Tax=Eumeta variegata TaxID=151549 RepID=A0A4C1TDI5_EUMVA|nr:hypothetical protein EVAR_92954_1 [Eumeta japonica]
MLFPTLDALQANMQGVRMWEEVPAREDRRPSVGAAIGRQELSEIIITMRMKRNKRMTLCRTTCLPSQAVGVGGPRRLRAAAILTVIES